MHVTMSGTGLGRPRAAASNRVPRAFRAVLATGALAAALGTLSVPAAAQAQSAAAGRSVAATGSAGSAAQYQVLFNRYQNPVVHVFVARSDGSGERAIVSTPGVQYSPSYSFDGQWVVFTSEREGQSDIYRVHPDGTGLEQLTDDPAFDDQAALSPDGRTLAFVSTRRTGTTDIWLTDVASGESRNLTAHPAGDFRPRWSPDGSLIAFTSDRDSDPGYNPGLWEHLQSTGVYVVAPDGTGLRRLTPEGGVAGSPAWSADGRQIFYYVTDEVGAYMAKFSNSRTEIVSVDVTTGELTRYTASGATKLSPRPLSDGRISYIARAGAEVGGGLRMWYPSRRVEMLIPGPIRGADWSPDGGSVVYERIAQLGSTERLDHTASADPDFDLLLSEPFPSFSPDGSRLLFSQYVRTEGGLGVDQANAGNTSIEIMNADGSDARTLFFRDGFSAFSGVWSPRGDRIALSVGRYFRAAGLPPGQIALIDPDGSNFELIVDDELNNGFPTWSSDGSRLAFKRGRQLVVMSLADREMTPLTDGSHYDNFPQWSPDNDLIMFTSDRDGGFDLYTMRPDGTALRRLTDTPGNDAHSAWCPGGDWIVFSSARMGFKDEMALYDGVPQPYGEIFAIRADGSDAHQLTDNKWEDASVGCRRMPVSTP